MGAKFLFRINVEDLRSTVAQQEIQRRVEAHTGKRIGNWKTTCTSYLPKGSARPSLVVVVLSEKPGSRFAATGSNIIETDAVLTTLLEKMQSLPQKVQTYASGVEYDLSDFRIRVGMIFEKAGPTSPMVEIEYRPCCVMNDCQSLITELMEKITAPLVAPQNLGPESQANVAAETNYPFTLVSEDFSRIVELRNATFSEKHTALLYLKLLNRNPAEVQ